MSTSTVTTGKSKTTKVVPISAKVVLNKNKNKKNNMKTKNDLKKLRKSKIFRSLGDAFDYFSD